MNKKEDRPPGMWDIDFSLTTLWSVSGLLTSPRQIMVESKRSIFCNTDFSFLAQWSHGA